MALSRSPFGFVSSGASRSESTCSIDKYLGSVSIAAAGRDVPSDPPIFCLRGGEKRRSFEGSLRGGRCCGWRGKLAREGNLHRRAEVATVSASRSAQKSENLRKSCRYAAIEFGVSPFSIRQKPRNDSAQAATILIC